MRIAEKKKSQIAALYEQCSGLPADVRSCLENGYFGPTIFKIGDNAYETQ